MDRSEYERIAGNEASHFWYQALHRTLERAVRRELARLGGQPKLREGFVTDNGNQILDVHGLSISAAAVLESELDHVVGVVCSGLFARRGADVLLLAGNEGVQTRLRPAVQ